MGPEKRSPALVIVLSLVTCGIYFYYWIYCVSKETRDFLGDESINPGMEVLLSIVTCGIYTFYWYYKYGRLVFDMEQRVGVSGASDMSLILLLLPIFGFGIVSLLLLQTELNRVWDTINPTSGPTDGTQGT